MEIRNYLMGFYGEPPGPVNKELAEKVLGKKKPITVRPADLLEPGLAKARTAAANIATSEEDVLSYALFPEVAKDFFTSRSQKRPASQAVVT
jgi:oxaloacetate decarboxylase alpha subunit